jgi:hypothetical protein
MKALFLSALLSVPAAAGVRPIVSEPAGESVEAKIHRITTAQKEAKPVSDAERKWAVDYLLAQWKRLTGEKRDPHLMRSSSRRIVHINRELGRKDRGLVGPRYWTARQLATRLEGQYGKKYGLWLLPEDRGERTADNIKALYEASKDSILERTYEDLKAFGVQP